MDVPRPPAERAPVGSEAEAAIEVCDLGVRYGRVQALDGVSVRFTGRSLGLLGPNGAGKSTLIKTLLGLVAPSTGTARVLGYDTRRDRLALRRVVGYVPERDCHIPGMTAVDYVTLGGELTGMPRNDAIQRGHEMLHFCGLGEARYRTVDGYSAGMKQRVKLAQALCHDPELIFLDEPTNGLDPEGRVALLGILRDLQEKKGIRVVLSSHLLRDVEFVCKEVVVVREGAIITHGSVEDLKKISDRHWLTRVRGDLDAFVGALGAAGCEIEPWGKDGFKVLTPEGEGARLLLEVARRHGCQVRQLQREELSLEDAFLNALKGVGGVGDRGRPVPGSNGRIG